MRWVAFWSLLYVAVLEFLFAVLFLSVAWSRLGDGFGRELVLFAFPLGLATTGVFLLLRHLWAYGLSVLLGLGLFGVAVKALLEYLLQPPPVHGGRGLGSTSA